MKKRIYPRIRLFGNDLLKRTGVVYSQILNDLLMKVDDGKSGEYEKGFFHTSTTTITDPNYYNQMWSRDVGRGIIELACAGLIEDAQSAVDYILKSEKNFGDHYGRMTNMPFGSHEVDGNVNLLLAFYSVWKYSGKSLQKGNYYLEQAESVFKWFDTLAEESPYGSLLASKSELSGNPDTSYFIYALYATYGAAVVSAAFIEMAKYCGNDEYAGKLGMLRKKLIESIEKYLISKGQNSDQNTKTPKGVYLNGIDERTGKAAETGDFGPEFDISKWTRQLPFIQDFELENSDIYGSSILAANKESYNYIKTEMAKGYFFRRYGFVSNTCFSGMGGRHDDTMAGYGQNFFSQAALLSDDVNVYTKCIEGIARLAYDGDIVAPLTIDLNPWVMHECFTYENYEQGLDHTFGRVGNEELHIMHNPGDEGNLVQSAETLKTFAIMAGINSNGSTLIIKPRLPWECDKAEIINFPVVLPNGEMARVSYEFILDRTQNVFILKVSGCEAFKNIFVRIGPLPNVLCNEEELCGEWQIQRKHCASFAEKTIMNNGDSTVTVTLINEKQ